jgi:hypothetical protein
MSDLYQASIASIRGSIGVQRTESIERLLGQSPQQISESLRSYFLVPFQRLLTGFKTDSLVISTEYKLGEGVVDDLEMILRSHLDYMPNLKKRVAGIAVVKLAQARDVLLKMLPILRMDLRKMYLPGGGDAINYLVGALVSGLFAEFINGSVGAIGEAVGVDPNARATLQILDVCLGRFRDEGMNLTEEQIRDAMARRSETEKQSILARIKTMTPDQKRIYLQNQRLGLQEFAVGGSKAIRVHDDEQYERERMQALQMGLNRFAVGVGAAQPRGLGEVLGGEGGAEVSRGADGGDAT